MPSTGLSRVPPMAGSSKRGLRVSRTGSGHHLSRSSLAGIDGSSKSIVMLLETVTVDTTMFAERRLASRRRVSVSPPPSASAAGAASCPRRASASRVRNMAPRCRSLIADANPSAETRTRVRKQQYQITVSSSCFITSGVLLCMQARTLTWR